MMSQYLFLKVTSNWATRYTISPNHGIMQIRQTCTITVELISLGVVCILSTDPGDYFLFGQIFVAADEVHGSRAIFF
jgi:hypothetical protein